MTNRVDRTILQGIFITLLFCVILLSCLTSFVGIMFPFAGFGVGMASVATHIIFVSMGIALPASIVLAIISRRVLALIYWCLYIITFFAMNILEAANRFQNHLDQLTVGDVVHDMFKSVAVLYLILALFAEAIAVVEYLKKAGGPALDDSIKPHRECQ